MPILSLHFKVAHFLPNGHENSGSNLNLLAGNYGFCIYKKSKKMCYWPNVREYGYFCCFIYSTAYNLATREYLDTYRNCFPGLWSLDCMI